MNNKIIWAVITVLVLVLGGLLFFTKGSEAPTEETFNQTTGAVVENKVATSSTSTSPSIKDFSVSAAPFSFTPSTMTVNKGDTVKITLKNRQGTHDLKIDEFSATTRILNAGEEQMITFVADKVGTFEYYCSVGNHRAMGIVGTLTVR